jgi:hypothetical protein
MRRSTLFLALLLVVSMVMYVDLVKVPQPASEYKLIGAWSFDDATEWDEILARSPQVSESFDRLQSTNPKAAEQFKSTIMPHLAVKAYLFTADKMIYYVDRVRYESSYTITTTSGNKLTADLIDNEGNDREVTITITADRLVMFHHTYRREP